MTSLNAALHTHFSERSNDEMQEIADRLAVCAVCFETGHFFLGEKMNQFFTGLCYLWGTYLDASPEDLDSLFFVFFGETFDPFAQFGASYASPTLDYPLRAEKCLEMREGVLAYIAAR